MVIFLLEKLNNAGFVRTNKRCSPKKHKQLKTTIPQTEQKNTRKKTIQRNLHQTQRVFRHQWKTKPQKNEKQYSDEQ